MAAGGGEMPNRAKMSLTGLFKYSARFVSWASINGPASMDVDGAVGTTEVT